MSRLLPYETIVKAHGGDPDAIDTVLSHYAGYIRYCSKVHGKINTEVEEYVKQKLITALFKFRFDPLIDSKQKIKEARDFMKNQLLTVTEVVVRSAFYWNSRMGYSCLMAYSSAAIAYEYAKRWLALAPDDPAAQKLVRDCEEYLEEEKALEIDLKEREEFIRRETPDDEKGVICK